MAFEILRTVLQGIPTTLMLTAAGLGIGAIGGLPLVIARVSPVLALRALSRTLIEVFRGVPPLVWLFIIYFGLGTSFPQIDPLEASMVGLGVISCAYMAEIYRGGLAAIHVGQWEAAKALGMSRPATVRRVIAPQVLRLTVPATATYGIGLLKDSSVAFTLGVTEILYWANDQSRVLSDPIKPFAIAALVYIAMSAICAAFARSLDTRLRQRVAR